MTCYLGTVGVLELIFLYLGHYLVVFIKPVDINVYLYISLSQRSVTI